MSSEAVELEYERCFDLFGTRVRLLVGEPCLPDLPPPEVVLLEIEGFLQIVQRRLTRFDPGSELCALNAAGPEEVRVSGMLAAALDAALWAARRSGGLVDPTLLDELELAGYRDSRKHSVPESIASALSAAPQRRPARPRSDPRWSSIKLDRDRLTVSRPTGVRIDLGGIGKGLAADLASARLAGYTSHVVDAGGDLRIGGERPAPRLVRIAHPLRSATAQELWLAEGAVATSGISTRLWKGEGADAPHPYAHHLIDPARGAPAWTGLLQASALAPTALEAETLAKMAYLSGPAGAAAILAEHGGLTIAEDGGIALFGELPTDRPQRMAA